MNVNVDSIPINSFWSEASNKELWLHKIHSYPAKFPSLIVNKSIKYAQDNGIEVDTIGDVFCGCGTTSLESKINAKNFWGCDINPVATLIAKAKSTYYCTETVQRYYNKTVKYYHDTVKNQDFRLLKDERINYWYQEKSIIDLNHLLNSIEINIPNGKYKNLFLCCFSNILKPTSRWLTKSIKPQIDKTKEVSDVIPSFEKQFVATLKAIYQISTLKMQKANADIVTCNFLKTKKKIPPIDLLVTSPPYVTAYEYADLHQLSTLWLGFTDNYRTLRKGTIGSLYHTNISNHNIKSLNKTGRHICNSMSTIDNKKALTIAKYFIDLEGTVSKCYKIMSKKSVSIFVIGNTSYKKVKIDNANYLIECMQDNGFKNVEIYKRKVQSKILTPYRNEQGKFTSNPDKKDVFSFEFVVSGMKY
ncbi:DNA methyltransferase [Tunicatimonas pelagia]|uniref:DNA methyltransferase n=1 Tax=Tunicatimonas pelagia TaxID=931531 RepID=UPI002665FB84|nr:DNA methyltransferase [Tunicatimonas pelagia]WKN43390.1 DNA methyltransferase [Tunicatimonas pelagia]